MHSHFWRFVFFTLRLKTGMETIAVLGVALEVFTNSPQYKKANFINFIFARLDIILLHQLSSNFKETVIRSKLYMEI